MRSISLALVLLGSAALSQLGSAALPQAPLRRGNQDVEQALRTRGGGWRSKQPPPPSPHEIVEPPAPVSCGGGWRSKQPPPPSPHEIVEPPAPVSSPLPAPALPHANLKAVAILSAAVGSWAVLRAPEVRTWFQDVSPLHSKYFPLSRHQVLIFLAWLTNKIAVRVPGRSDGKSWKDAMASPVRFFTPSGYAFAIWAPIFLGELMLTFYQLGSSRLAPALHPYLARIAPPLAQAFAAQSLWCLAFRPWVGRMQFVPTALLAMTAVGLSRVHTILREGVAAGAMRPWDYVIVHLPLSLHFGWITCATLVNLNGWFAVAPSLRTGDKLGLALASVNVAVTLGGQITLASGDPVIALVVAWALYAVADDLLPSKSILRKNGLVGDDALDCLEISARVSAFLQAGLAGAVMLWKLLLRAGVVAPGDAVRLMTAAYEPVKSLFT